jgi:transposase InsO family protein
VAGPQLSWWARPLFSVFNSSRDCRIAIDLCNHQLLALVDTGATVSVISADYAALLPTHLYPQTPVNTSLLSVNGSNVEVSAVVTLPIKLFDYSLSHTFYISPSVKREIILGHDFLLPNGVILDFSNQVFIIANHFVPMVTTGDHSINAVSHKTSLSPDQLQQVHSLLMKYAGLHDGKPGRTQLATHRIETGDARPVKAYRKPLSPSDIAEIDKQLAEMLANGIVSPSESSWSSPVTLVSKADGTKRFAIDYRRLNAVTRKIVTPIPLQTEFFDHLGKAKYITTLDLKSGYWQIPVHPLDRCKTAFVTHRGLFHFNMMPFGLTNAPFSFQTLMNKVLADLIYRRNVLVFVDDIIIWSSSFEEHMQLLDEVCDRIQRAGLKLNLKKCKIFTNEVKFLGHVVNADGVRVDPAKVAAIANYPQPTTAAALRRFYGMASYLRRHVPNFAALSAPLCNLLGVSESEFVWTTAHTTAFNELRSAIANAAQLSHPRFDQPFRIAADASDFAIGCMLSQLDDDGVDCPIAFASRKLNPAETRYATIEKEALALVFATQQFRHYIYGSPIVMLSDHKPLLGLRTSTKLNARLQRWVLWLEQFNFDIEYIPGPKQIVADALSRAPSDFDDRFDELAFPPIVRRIDLTADCRIEDATIRHLQLHDPVFGSILQQLVTDRRIQPTGDSPDARRLASKYRRIREIGGLFYLQDHNRNLLLIPEALRSEVLYYCHSNSMSGHLGIKSTLDRLQSAYYWPSMGNDTRRFVLACDACGQAKPQNCQTTAPLTPLNASRPLEFVSMDIVTLPFTPRGNIACLVITDLFTKWAEAFPLRSHTADDVVPCLLEFISRYGIPDTLLTDQGAEFESDLLDRLYQQLGLRKIRTAAYHPQTDGQAERFNRSLIEMLRATTTDRKVNWDEVLAPVLFAYRSSVNSSTGFSPYEMLYGRAPKLPGHLVLGEFLGSRKLPDAHVTALQRILRKMWEEANCHLDAARARQKRYFDRFSAERRFEVGDLVWLAAPPRTQKLLPRYLGPFQIEKRFDNNVNYRIRKVDNDARFQPFVVNIDRLKPCGQFEDWMARPAVLPTFNQVPPVQQQDRVEPHRVMTRTSKQPYRPGLVDTETALKHI